MALPKSLGDSNASAEQLVRESQLLSDPYGIPTLKIQPAQFGDIAKDEEVLKATLRDTIQEFFKDAAKGDAQRQAQMNAIVFNGGNFADNKQYLLTRTAMSALDENYGDAHALCVREDKGEPLAGVIIMPRAERSFGTNAENATGVSASQFAPPTVPVAQLSFMTIWHEYAHAAGADEAQADKMAAIMARKAFPSSNVLQVYADLRIIDSLLDYNSQPREFTNKKGEKETIPARHEIYGWRMAEAVDEVAAMPQEKIHAMDEKTIRKITEAEIGHPKYDALRRVGDTLTARHPELFEYKKANLKEISAALQTLLKNGTFDNDPDALAIASRSLLAISRVALDGPKLEADIAAKSRFATPKLKAEIPVSMNRQPNLKPPSL